ncbi:Protein of unknown function [Bacillus mobilis]|nr:Protein of unknown function [Bacillus mobilis]
MKFVVTVVMSLKAIVDAAKLVNSIHAVVVVDVIHIHVNVVMNVVNRKVIVDVAEGVIDILVSVVMSAEKQIVVVVVDVIRTHVNVVVAAVNLIDIVDAIDKKKHHLKMVFYLYCV